MNKQDKIKAYKILDGMLSNTINEWSKMNNHDEDLNVWTSGSVLFGEWHAYRNPEIFDGLKFKFTEEMMDEFVTKNKITLTHKDMINQDELK